MKAVLAPVLAAIHWAALRSPWPRQWFDSSTRRAARASPAAASFFTSANTSTSRAASGPL